MEINLSAPAQFNVNRIESQASINIAGESSSTDFSLGTSAGVSNGGISPAPVIQVRVAPASEETVLESPFIQITQQTSNSNNSLNQEFTRPATVDNTQQQVQELVQEQQNVQSRQQQLETQEDAIEREISELQKKELEINRQRFRLQQQSTGNLLNIRI